MCDLLYVKCVSDNFWLEPHLCSSLNNHGASCAIVQFSELRIHQGFLQLCRTATDCRLPSEQGSWTATTRVQQTQIVAQHMCGPLTGHLDLKKVNSVRTRHPASCKQISCRQQMVCTALSAEAVVVYNSKLGTISRQLSHSTHSGGFPTTLSPAMMSCHKVDLWHEISPAVAHTCLHGTAHCQLRSTALIVHAGGQCSSQAGQQAPTVQPAGSRSSTVDTPAPSWPPSQLTQQQRTAAGTGPAAVPTSQPHRADAARTAGRTAHSREPLSRSVAGPGQTAAAPPAAAQEPLARAAGAAARAARWLGTTASSGLDRLLGFDPALAADAPAARQHTPRASQVQQHHPPQQQQVEPSQQHEHRYFTRQAAQARNRSSASVQQQQQQQQQQQRQMKPQDQPEHVLRATPQQRQQRGSSASQGLLLALVLGMVAVVSDIVTAVTTAYTESLRPGAELLWHISAALLLYLLLPLLRLLLAAMKLVLRSLGWLLQAANRAIGRALHSKGAPHRPSKLRQLLVPTFGRRQPCAGNKQQQQLVRLAEQQLCRLNNQYPGVLHPLEFATVSSSTGQFGPDQLLGPASGYGCRSFRGSGPAGQAVAVLVQQLDTQHDVEQWCAVVEALAALQQASDSAEAQETSSAGSASTSDNKAPTSALLQVFGATVGAVPAAALQPTDPAAGAWLPATPAPPLASAADVATVPTCQLRQQQGSCAVVGLVAVQLVQQPTSLLSALRGAATINPSTGTPGRVDTRSDPGASQAAGAARHPAANGAQCLADTCHSLSLAPQVAAAVESLCVTLAGAPLVTASPAQTATPAAAAHISAALQDTSAVQLAAALVVGVPTAGQPARVWLNPAALLLQPQPDAVMREFEVQLCLSATRQLSQGQGNTGTAASWDAGAAGAAGASAAASCADGVQECMAKLEQCSCSLQRCRPEQVRSAARACSG